ncbi:MAG: lysophospholipid acyltransferase family protein [Candidatus Omnitrophica bacterium]|nr:lysophospholipid acyltransferase family protein [Candidatus Omnitrophota bacterium]
MHKYILYKIGKFLALRLSLKAAYAIAVFLSDFHFLISRTDRRAVIGNLNAIFPNAKENLNLSREVFRNFGKYLVDFFRIEKLNRDKIEKVIKIENLEVIDKILAQKRGIIILSAHMGNWELGGMIMGFLGYPIYGVILPHKDKRTDSLFNRQREIFGERVIPLGRAARSCIECLNNNKIIALVGDRDFTTGGIIEDFFGRESLIPKGPAGFSLKTGSPIVPGFVIRQKDDSFKLIFGEPIEPSITDNKDNDLHDLTKRCLRIIEDYIKKYPSQWLMFRKFWLK